MKSLGQWMERMKQMVDFLFLNLFNPLHPLTPKREFT